METITAYEDLARLVTGHFHRGVRTNTMVSPEEYGPAIAAGTLRAQATPAGLLLLRDRGDHTRLTFYLGDLTVPLGAELPRPTVTEVAFRPRDTGLRETVSYLTAQGFVPVLERLRLSRPAGETGEPALPLSTPAPEALSSVQAFLQSNFLPPDRLPSQPGRTGPGSAPGPCTHLGGRGRDHRSAPLFPGREHRRNPSFGGPIRSPGHRAHPPSAGRVSPCHRRCQKCCVDPL